MAWQRTLTVGGLIAVVFLGTMPLWTEGEMPQNREDEWPRAILVSLLQTANRVIISVGCSSVVALPLALVLPALLPRRPSSAVLWFCTLFAAFPLVAWVYVVTAAPVPLSARATTVTAASVAIVFPLLLAFLIAIGAAFEHRIIRHIRQLGAGRSSQLAFALRVAGPDLLEAVCLGSLAAWSVVIFAETQVAVASDQGLGGLLNLWSRNGSVDFMRISIGCLAVCSLGVFLGQSIRAAAALLRSSNELDY